MKRKILSLMLIALLSVSLVVPAVAVFSDGPNNSHYNRSEAAEYVATYTLSPNTDEYMNYDTLGGDCTNFASQVLVAGGFEMTEAVASPNNQNSWYFYNDNPGWGRTGSWTGAHEFRQYWADVDGSGGKHAYEFIKYNASEFDNDDTWYEIYEYLEPGDIVQYVYGYNGDTYHTQIVHRTSYENGEYKVSMGQHSPHSWINLRNYVCGLSNSTIVCLIKMKNPAYGRSLSANTYGLQSQSRLGTRQDEVFYTKTNNNEEENEKWAEFAAIKHEMISRAKSENYSYKTKATIDVLLEFIDTRVNNNDQIIIAYSDNGTDEAETVMEACKQENAKLQLYRTSVIEGRNDKDAFAMWQYYWEEILHEDSPSYFTK